MQTNNTAATQASAGLRLDQLPDHQWATVLDVARPDGAEDRELVLRLTEIGFVHADVRDDARSLGFSDPQTAREIFEMTITDVITPQLVDLGLDPGNWRDLCA